MKVWGIYLLLLGFVCGNLLFEEELSLKPIFASQILSHTGGKMHHYGDYGVSKRLTFIGDPMQGDASISFSDVRLSDTGTYQCKVKKAPGVDMRKVTLVVMGEEEFCTGFTRLFSHPSHSSSELLLSFVRNVDALHTSDGSPLAHHYSSHHELKALMCLFILSSLVPPSVPKCWVESGEEKGGPVSLRCKSYLGSTPLSYTWKRESGGVIPPTATQGEDAAYIKEAFLYCRHDTVLVE